MLEAPIGPWNQTVLPFGRRSHWIQPWRAYLDTPPTSHARDAMGINFNVSPEEADATARLLADSGVRRARVEIGWGEIAYDDPGVLRRDDPLTLVRALVRHGIRPLILLNSNEGRPTAQREITLVTSSPAARGDRQVHLDPESASLVVPGLTGFDGLTGYRAAEVLITGVGADGVATLSRPLPADLAAGPHAGSILQYEPFSRPVSGDGSPSPRFEATLAGWLAYVSTVTREVRTIVGSDDFDVEVWNELTFGSDFLDINRYYSPDVNTTAGDATEVTTRAILERTVAWLRDPAHGVAGVGIGDGFANQRPWEAGSIAPVGLTAIDKHPYPPDLSYPGEAPLNGVQPVNALGVPEGSRDADGRWVDAFIPSYSPFFPEYSLSGIQTETIVRDLSPLTTDIYGTPHGRLTAPAGGTPPELWITELNMEGVERGIARGGATAAGEGPPALVRRLRERRGERGRSVRRPRVWIGRSLGGGSGLL